MFQGFADNGSAASDCFCLFSVRKGREKKRANFHTEFVIVRDLAFVSRGGAGEREKKRPSACFIRVPGEKDYGAGMWCKAQSFWV